MSRIVPERSIGHGLAIVGAVRAADYPDALVPEGIATLFLLGPDGPNMWTAFSAAPEAKDGAPHPMDRWSKRVIEELATAMAAKAFFPFTGPPWHPFQRWAAAGEGAVTSPVAMQASPRRGLWASYRGAIGFAEDADPSVPGPSPCLNCPAPCLTACPVNAFADGAYDTATCVAHVDGDGHVCRDGCLVRRACPAGAEMKLPVAQRQFHMDAFLRAQRG